MQCPNEINPAQESWSKPTATDRQHARVRNATHLLKGGKGGGGGGRKWNSGERCHARVKNIIHLQKGEREGEGSGLGERDIMHECKMGGGGGGGGELA